MSVPDYQSFMLPLLRLTEDKGEHRLADLQKRLAEEFGLTDDDIRQLFPSGRQTVLANRVGWASTYLRKAGVLESPRRAVVKITERGRNLLAEDPARIDVKLLDRYQEFRDFRARQGATVTPTASITSNHSLQFDSQPPLQTETPQEALDRNYLQLVAALRDELLARIKTMPTAFFERLVVDLMLKLGYGSSLDAGRTLGRSGDGGVDGVINEDKLGLDVVYLQAKRWEGTVGRPEVQAFSGSLDPHRATKGVFLTTSLFSREAHEYVKQIGKRIVLIDGQMLAGLMIEAGLGVTTTATYEIKRVDSDYFAED